MLLPEFGKDILGCHQTVPTWVTHIRLYVRVRDKFPADKSGAGQVSEGFWGL